MARSTLAWFEIPVGDFERARTFYESVFQVTLTIEDDAPVMLKGVFPMPEGGQVTGSIAWGEDWNPSPTGVIPYFDGGEDLAPVLERVTAAGGEVVEPKTEVAPGYGFFGRFRDLDGNLIGVLSPN